MQSILIGLFMLLFIGLFARKYSIGTRLLLIATIVSMLVLLYLI